MPGLVLTLAGLFTLAVFGTTSSQSVGCCEDYCYATDNELPQYQHFSSKTAYDRVRGKDSVNQYVVENCTPVKFWMLARHGTRLPSASSIRKLRNLSEIRDKVIRNYLDLSTQPENGALCNEDIELLRSWTFDANITDAKGNMLTVQGWNDLRYLGNHFKAAFPQLLDSVYSPQKFQFKYSNTDRTFDSMKAFLEGLFGHQAYDRITLPSPLEDDILLKPYDMCPAHTKNADATDDKDSEVSKFADGPLFQQLLQDVSRRLALNETLKESEIETMFDACRYEQAWTLDRASPWCAAFTLSQVKILEYAQDLKYFNDVGYANPNVTSNLACSAVSDMLNFFEADESYKVTAYLAHSATIQLFLTAMGAGRDSELLLADNYDRMQSRKYRSSENTPFAANVAAIKYECPNDAESTKIMLTVNQKPIDLPLCKEGLCNWTDLKREYARFTGADCAKIFCSGASQMCFSVGLLIVISLISWII